MATRSRLTVFLTVLFTAFCLVGPTIAPAADEQPKSPQAMLQAARQRAIDQIIEASRSDQAELRMNAIEAMQPMPSRARPLAELGLDDQNKAVRFAALVIIGKLKLEALGEAARDLVDDPAPSVRAAARFAAHQCGIEVNLTPLAELAGSQNPTVRGNVVMLLGLMGEPSAKRMLQDVARQPMPKVNSAREAIVRLQIAEAMVQLGQDDALQPLRADMFSRHLEARVLAVTVLGEIGDQKMVPAMQQMLQEPPIELQLAAGKALARMGYDDGLDVLLTGARMTPAEIGNRAERFLNRDSRVDVGARFKKLTTDAKLREAVAANIRVQAAFGLGHLMARPAAKQLTQLLDDQTPSVRLAAAAAIVQALEGQPASASAATGSRRRP
jgi:HEAT repeat protein